MKDFLYTLNFYRRGYTVRPNFIILGLIFILVGGFINFKLKEKIAKRHAEIISKNMKKQNTESREIVCKHCGQEIEGDSQFCRKCGKEQ